MHSFLRCVLRCVGVGVMFPCQPLWAEAGMCMLTRSLHLDLSSYGVGRADCRFLNNNAITELAATLFDTLTNLKKVYVTLNAAMHAPSPS